MKTLLSVIFFSFCFGAYSQKYETGKYFINEKKDTIYITPEQMPEFPGGLKNCMRFLSKNTKYLQELYKCTYYNGPQIRSIVQFTINEDGSISDIKLLKHFDCILDKEALRVISIMPKWKPGVHKGKVIKTQYSLPVTFRLL